MENSRKVNIKAPQLGAEVPITFNGLTSYVVVKVQTFL